MQILTHMVKCLGICFSLCCALCSPPQRTRGGSNMAATIKREQNPRETEEKKEKGQPAVITFYYVFFFCICSTRRTKSLVRYIPACAYIELFSEELAIIRRAYPVLLLQRVQRDGEVPLGWRGRPGEEDDCLLSCV